MKNALVKDTVREIKKSFGRFLSIFAIVGIGVAFFAGVKEGEPVMKSSADKYFDEYNLMDIRVVSPIGLTDDDVAEIKKLDGIKGTFPTHSIDVLTEINSSEFVLKVHGIPLEDAKNDTENYINRAEIKEGRLPEKSGECIVGAGNFNGMGVKVGDKIKLTSGTKDDISENLKVSEFTIVGIANTPNYLSFEMGSSNIGHGSINNFIMIPEEDFNMDIYTEVLLTVEGAKELNSYANEYFDVTDKVTKPLENLSHERSPIRFNEILEESRKELENGKKEYVENKIKYENEIKSNEEKLQDGKIELIISEKELDKQEKEFPNQIKEGKEKLVAAEKELQAGEEEYNKNLKAFNDLKESTESSIKDFEEYLNSHKTEVDNLRVEVDALKERLKDTNLSDEEKDYIKSEITRKEKSIQIYDFSLSAVSEGKNQIANAEQKLKEGRATLDSGWATLNNEKANIQKAESEGENAFVEGRKKIEEGKQDIKQGEEELERAKKLGEEELALAKEKLDKAEKDLQDAKAPDWYVLDRNSHYSYMDYGASANKMGDIANVFPVFFFLVAALVCLTTMTRMVDEQRGNIGTLKALGYSKLSISSKYIVYAAVASTLGALVGLAIGVVLFPTVIFYAWGIMYTVPKVKLLLDLPLSIISILVAVSVTTLAAVLACYKELIETPSLLMRPKAPKEGKRIFLERISFIWKRMNFTEKVTARNIFRYKKRFFMTVIGISGCTALLLAGFGIKDSISTIASKQFGEIIKYDSQVSIDKDSTLTEKEDLFDKYKNDSRVEDISEMSTFNSKAIDDGEDKSVKLIVPKNISEFKDFISLRERSSQKEIQLDNSGVVITEKLSKSLGVKKGDKITIENEDGDRKEVEVSAISEMYVDHYVFMSPEYYKSTFGVTNEINALALKLNDTSTKVEEVLGTELMDNDIVKSVSFYSGLVNNFDNMISSLNIVVIVLIVSAGALAFVVLYNLTNVNVSERLREIATIKVLGFYDNEVSAYVYRENLVLTAIGSIVGLALGTILHRFIMITVEFDAMMFGRNINILSYLIAVVITMGFAILVNLVMYKKLKKIPMVESLKSVE